MVERKRLYMNHTHTSRALIQPASALMQNLATDFEWPIRIYWEDTDAGGIVYHARYLHFFERARTEWLRSLGIDQFSLKQTTGGMFVVQSLQLRYAQPAYLDDFLLSRTRLIHLGKASCSMRQILQKGTQIVADFEIRLGFIRADNANPMRLPQGVYDTLTPLLSAK